MIALFRYMCVRQTTGFIPGQGFVRVGVTETGE